MTGTSGTDTAGAPATPATRPGFRPQPAEWLWLVVGAALLVRYRWVMDDAFVYFRYVDNLLFLRLGLVHNPGEYVEGFSSPAWLLLLAVLRAPGLPYGVILPAVGLATLLALWTMLVAVRCEQTGDAPTLNLPMALLLPNYGFLCYLTSGVDTPLVLLAGCAYALFVLRPRSAPAGIVVALSPLIRPELVLPLALAVLWAWRVTGRFPARIVAIAAAATGGWEAFRILYYADLFPVTFHLKNQSLPEWGIAYLLDTTAAYHLGWVAAGCAGLAAAAAFRGERPDPRSRAVMLALAAPVILYVVKIGGDARHFRYLAFPYCLVVCALGGLPEAAARAFRLPRAGLLLPVAGLAVGAMTLASYPRQLDRHPLLPGVRHRMVDRITDAQLHRDTFIPSIADWGRRVTPDVLRAFRASPRFGEPWPVEANELCIENYVAYDRFVVHSYGLTEAVLARADVPSVRAGHKDDLVWMSADLAKVLGAASGAAGRAAAGDAGSAAQPATGAGAPPPDALTAAIAAGTVPRWMRDNAEAIAAIERKVHNRHRPLENLRLALAPPVRLTVPSRFRER